MSVTSGTQAAAIQKKRSLADIVREKTNDGETIVQFYLDVASGRLDGFRDNHRMAAANKITRIAPSLVALYLVKYQNSSCRDSLRGRSLLPVRRSPVKWAPLESRETTPPGPNVFQRRLAQIACEETGDGRAIVVFVVGVMHGALTDFKPHHRLEAADKLAGYLRAEPDPLIADPTRIVHAEPARIAHTEPTRIAHAEPTRIAHAEPVEAPTPVRTEPGPVHAEPTRIVRAEPVEAPTPDHAEPVEAPTPVRTEAGPTHAEPTRIVRAEPVEAPTPVRTETGPAHAEPARIVRAEPVEAPTSVRTETGPVHAESTSPKTPSSAPSAASAVNSPITLEDIERFNYEPTLFDRYMFARDEITGGIYAFDGFGPVVVDEDGVTHSMPSDEIVGYERVIHAYRNRDRWPDDVPKPYEDFSSNPSPSGRRHNPIKIWV